MLLIFLNIFTFKILVMIILIHKIFILNNFLCNNLQIIIFFKIFLQDLIAIISFCMIS